MDKRDWLLAIVNVALAFALITLICNPPLNVGDLHADYKTYMEQTRNNPVNPPPTIEPTPNPYADTGENIMRSNGLWCTVADSATAAASRAVAGNIKTLNLQVGNWMINSGGTVYDIYEWYSPSQVVNWVATAKSVDPTLKVCAWVLHMNGFNGENYDPNVDSGSNRAGIISIMQDYIVNTTSGVLDGFCDDIESISGSNSNLAVLWNSMGAALHGTGRIFNCCPMFYSSIYSTGGLASTLYPNLNSAYIDTVYPMMYPDEGGPYAPAYTQAYMDWICSNTDCNIALGLCVRPQGPYSITLSQQLAGIDAQIASHGEYSNWVGCCLWEYDTIEASDWAVWNAWATKNGEGGGSGDPGSVYAPAVYLLLQMRRR